MVYPNNRQRGAVLDEGGALIAGIIASLIAVGIAVFAIHKTLQVIGHFVWLGIALYTLGLFVQYWAAQSYKDGLTIKEVSMAILWPIDTYRTIKAGLHRERGAGALLSQHIPASEDTSMTLIGEKAAFIGGVLLSLVVGLPLIGYGVSTVLDIVGDLIWLGVAGYLIGFVVTFWTAQSYKDGLTSGEIILSAIWPVDLIRRIREGVRSQRASTS